MSKYYEVRFYTRRNGKYNWVIQVVAQTAKEAREIAIQKWACDTPYGGMHQFGIKVHPLKVGDKLRWPDFTVIPDRCFNS